MPSVVFKWNNSILMVLVTVGILARLTLAGRAQSWLHAAPFIAGAIALGIVVFVLIVRDAATRKSFYPKRNQELELLPNDGD